MGVIAVQHECQNNIQWDKKRQVTLLRAHTCDNVRAQAELMNKGHGNLAQTYLSFDSQNPFDPWVDPFKVRTTCRRNIT